ncbi:META domain-containing protein [Chitinophaga caeni]|nr:META domain-containing protein [Chitinophaga caeni]
MKKQFLLLILIYGSWCCACQQQGKKHPTDSTEAQANTQAPSVNLDGTRWQLTQLREQIVLAKDHEKEIYMQFSQENNQVHGFLGCNSFNANFAVNGSKIAITDLVSTRVACPALPTEQGFQTALSEANSFKLEQGNLYLFKQDTLIAEFKSTPIL